MVLQINIDEKAILVLVSLAVIIGGIVFVSAQFNSGNPFHNIAQVTLGGGIGLDDSPVDGLIDKTAI